MPFSRLLRIPLAALTALLLAAFASAVSAQPNTPVHGLKVGDCVQFNDFAGTHTATIAQSEVGGGYQVSWNGMTLPVPANSRDIQQCPRGTAAPQPAAPPFTARGPAGVVAGSTPAPPRGFKVGDCVQFSYGGGWQTATVAEPEVAGAYQVNWGTIRAPASANPRDIRACPAGVMAVGGDAATKAAMARLPKGNGLGAQYGTRNPAVCANRKVAITPATAKMLLMCDSEGLLGETLYLISGATVQVGPPRAFIYNQDSAATGIDARQPVYDIRGSYTRYQCKLLSDEPNNFAKTHNCFEYPGGGGGYGRCYTNTFGDKHCQMSGGGTNTQLRDQPPPPAY